VNEASRVRVEAIPTDQQIENGHGEGQTGLKVDPNAMHDFHEMANGGQHGQDRFDDHALIMVEWLIHLQIGWISVFVVKAMIREDHGAIFVVLDERLKGAVMDIRRVTTPIDHLTEMVEQETQFAPTIQRRLEYPFLPICCSERPSRTGWINSIL
jgi:hypothetical protein